MYKKTNKRNNFLFSVGIILLLLLSAQNVIGVNTNDNNIKNVDDTVREEGNVTALIMGGPGYFINIRNGKDTEITANISVSINNFMVDDQIFYNVNVPAGKSTIFYELGGLISYIMARISIDVTYDGQSVSDRSGFVIFGIVIFIPKISTE